MAKLLRNPPVISSQYRRWPSAVVAVRSDMLTILICLPMFALPAAAQSPPATTDAHPSLCSRTYALELIQQQIDLSKTIDDSTKRITVLIRAANLMWPLQQDKARVAFKDAFEIAVQSEKEQSAQPRDNRSLLMELPDQRYVVIRAVNTRDPAWAKKLTEQILTEENQSSVSGSKKDSINDLLTAQRFLESATDLAPSNLSTALAFARMSLKYPATHMLTRFLYTVAQVNQQAADDFYGEALTVYAERPMREFLYLSTYPFGFVDGGDMPVFGYYVDVVPGKFVFNSLLQQFFVGTLVRRAEQAIVAPQDEADNYNGLPRTGHIIQVLMRIEPQLRTKFPDLLAVVVQTKENLLMTLTAETQKKLTAPGQSSNAGSGPNKTFAERIESAQKNPNANIRDDLIAGAVLGASKPESIDRVLSDIDKISDTDLRDTLTEWLYFTFAMGAVKGRQFAEAERLTAKVESRELRPYLKIEIAKGLLNNNAASVRGREVLEEGIAEANKSATTIYAARALLTAADLYSKIELSRSLSVLGDAINCTNHLEAPDFAAQDQSLVKTPRRKSNRGRFMISFYMPGLDPERAFRELAKIEFEATYSQTAAFNDKFQRAMTTLAVAQVCLEEAPRPAKRKTQTHTHSLGG